VVLGPFAAVVTVTFLAVRPAPAVMVKVAVTVVSFTAAKLLTLTPRPDTVTPVAPAGWTSIDGPDGTVVRIRSVRDPSPEWLDFEGKPLAVR